MRVACVQLAPTDDPPANVERAVELIERAVAVHGVEFVALPEKWNAIGEASLLHAAAEPEDGPTVTAMCEVAERLGVWLLAGSTIVRDPGHERLRNLSALITPQGSVAARYAKSHMFDVDVAGVSYRESDASRPGDEIVTSDIEADGGTVRLGMTVCYDLRFPELYRLLALRGARIFTVPAAFTMATGRDHWEVLLRARAIENGCFVIAPDIVGEHGAGKVSYGRSMIIDPWGTVLATAADGEGLCVADLDLAAVDRVRASIPSLTNRRPDLYAITGEPGGASDRTPSTT